MTVIKVSATSRSTAVAGAITAIIRKEGWLEIQTIGATALNQAIKAVVIARDYVQPENIDLVCIPSFTEVQIDDKTCTAIRLLIKTCTYEEPTLTNSES